MATKKKSGEKFKDLVCGSYVGDDEDRAEYKGKIYYFCCQGCKDLFQENPEKYLTATKTG